MLFTVVESRDARLVLEDESRAVKVTVEGSDLGCVVGDRVRFGPAIEAFVPSVGEGLPVVAATETAGVTHDLSDDQMGRNDPEISVEEQAAIDSIPLAEPAAEQ